MKGRDMVLSHLVNYFKPCHLSVPLISSGGYFSNGGVQSLVEEYGEA